MTQMMPKWKPTKQPYSENPYKKVICPRCKGTGMWLNAICPICRGNKRVNPGTSPYW